MAYITAEQLAAHLNMGGEPTAAEGEALDRAVASGCSAVDEYCGRTRLFQVPAGDAEATTRTYRTSGPTTTLFIHDATEVTLVEESLDGQTWSERLPPGWHAEPFDAAADGRPIECLCSDAPWAKFVRVTAVWGWPAIPPAVPSAALIKAARLYRRKDSPEGVEGTDGFGVVRISRFEDGDVQLLLARLRRDDAMAGIA